MKRTKEEAAKTRELIVNTAYELFLKKGYDATTLKDIVEKADLSRGAMYWYFDNKDDLYSEVISNILARMYNGKLVAVQNKSSLTDAFTHLLMLPVDEAADYKTVIQTIDLAQRNEKLSPLIAKIEDARQKLKELIYDLLNKNTNYSEIQLHAYTNIIYYLFEGLVNDSSVEEISIETVNQMIISLLSNN